jgi:hypothetical protein
MDMASISGSGALLNWLLMGSMSFTYPCLVLAMVSLTTIEPWLGFWNEIDLWLMVLFICRA